jgi:hypothetical protein
LLQAFLVTREKEMMPVIRISDGTYAHLQRHAKPFEDSPESIIVKALAALDMMNGDTPPPAVRPEQAKRKDGTKLPQKEFRLPLLMTLLKVGGSAPAKEIRTMLEPLMAHRLGEGDYESVSTGDPRWWNAVCWERSDLVKLGMLRDDSERGIWEISDAGRKLPASLHRRENGTDRMVSEGSLVEMAERFWRRPIGPRPFIMVDDMMFEEVVPLNPVVSFILATYCARPRTSCFASPTPVESRLLK